MNGVTITHQHGDYGMGESRERRQRTRRHNCHKGPNGDKWHASLSPAEVTKKMNAWARLPQVSRIWHQSW